MHYGCTNLAFTASCACWGCAGARTSFASRSLHLPLTRKAHHEEPLVLRAPLRHRARGEALRDGQEESRHSANSLTCARATPLTTTVVPPAPAQSRPLLVGRLRGEDRGDLVGRVLSHAEEVEDAAGRQQGAQLRQQPGEAHGWCACVFREARVLGFGFGLGLGLGLGFG